MLAETSMGQSVIQDHLSQLREMFSLHGLNVDGMTVTVGNDPSAFDASANQQEYQFQGETYQFAAKSIDNNHNAAESRHKSNWLHNMHTVDYTV